jgi:hypothetical protein
VARSAALRAPCKAPRATDAQQHASADVAALSAALAAKEAELGALRAALAALQPSSAS